MGESLKRPPRGYDKDHVHVEDLKRKDVAVHRSLTEEQVCAPDFAEQLAVQYREGAGLVRFLCEAVELPF